MTNCARAIGLASMAVLLLCAPSPGATPAPRGEPFVQRLPDTDVSFEMVPVPGGTFLMGSPDTEKGRKKDEGPQIEVEVEPFHMGKYEVTWPEYEAFQNTYHRLAGLDPEKLKVPEDKLADAVTYPTPMYELEVGPMLQRMGGRGKGLPAVSVSQFAARQYTKWLSKKTGRFYRLPTEAEWEYACRAGTTTAYSFGDDPKGLEDHGWYFDNSALDDGDGAYHAVGRKKPNAWGLYDMHGNVGEWCIDAHAPDWYARFAGRKVRAGDMINWPARRYGRVIRGGGWESEATDCRSAARIAPGPELNAMEPCIPKGPHWETCGFWVGFRVVSPAKEPADAEKLRFWNADDAQTIETLKRDREFHEVIPSAGRGK
jgi:formylglycine-generating enzyme required for sulfatase activity